MTQAEFDAFVAVALGVCRSAARVELPIEEMLAEVETRVEALYGNPLQPETEKELAALRQIITLVGDVAAIGARLPPDSRPIRVPAPPEGGSFPAPANVLREE